MTNSLTLANCFITVDDPEAALAFYRDVLDLTVVKDVKNGDFRWLTFSTPTQPELEIVVQQIGVGGLPMSDEDKQAQASLLAKGLLSALIFSVDDVDALFEKVRASGADVYLTSDLRHHPVSELRERAEFEALGGLRARATPYLVDVPHFASEWPWLEGAARDLRASLARGGTTVETRVSTRRTDPWTARLASSEGTTL